MKPIINLEGKVGLITGIANEKSISTGVAESCIEAGAKVVITYQNEKTLAFLEPIVTRLGVEDVLPLDVTKPETMDDVFAQIDAKHGKLDFAIHSMAFAKRDDLHGRVVDTSPTASRWRWTCPPTPSCAWPARPSRCSKGRRRFAHHHDLPGQRKGHRQLRRDGPVQGRAGSRHPLHGLRTGPKNIRVNAISPGPLMTRAASGIAGFDGLMAAAVDRSPLHRLVTPEDIGALTAFLVSDAGRNMSGGVHFVDAGYNIIG
jgi:enoyl-[acyl-carrier protein] reductase I